MSSSRSPAGMSTSLPSDLAAQIRAQIATGDFQSEEQVLREALSALEKRQRSLAKLKALVGEAEADVTAGRVGPFDRDELKREVRAHLAAQGIVD
jgi:antitoxin ParD1/3/4